MSTIVGTTFRFLSRSATFPKRRETKPRCLSSLRIALHRVKRPIDGFLLSSAFNSGVTRWRVGERERSTRGRKRRDSWRSTEAHQRSSSRAFLGTRRKMRTRRGTKRTCCSGLPRGSCSRSTCHARIGPVSVPRPCRRWETRDTWRTGAPFLGTDLFHGKKRNEFARDRTFASFGYEAFDFQEEHYHEVHIRLVQASSDGGSQGSILLLRKEDGLREEGTNILVIGIGGDALVALITLIQGKDSLRPLALDLLWQILERGRDISTQEWQLQKVAIVRLEDGIFYGRLFFGSEEGLVVWDCDCRPSDALWLATKQSCPILVHRDVWNEASVPVESIIESRAEEATSKTPQESETVDPLRSIVGGDPEPIKRLKRELDVAISEEDYSSAARIRDHPFMKLYACMIGAGKKGDEIERKRLEGELRNLINQQEGLSS